MNAVSNPISVDFHNHLLVGVDDGASTLDECRSGLTALHSSGIRHLVATFHIDASAVGIADRYERLLNRVDDAFEQLTQVGRGAYPDMEIRRGAEVKIDVPAPDLADPRLRLGGSSFVLVEFPTFDLPPFGGRMIAAVREGGWRPILAHPERYAGSNSIRAAREWIAAGAQLQLNHGSIVGRYGERAQTVAFEMLEEGLVSYLSSDYHSRGETWIASSVAMISSRPNGPLVLETLQRNAERMLADEEPTSVPPLGRDSVWGRMTRRLTRQIQN